MRKGTPPLADRFWARVKITANPDKCWEWTGPVFNSGYGQIGDHRIGEHTTTHRLAYKLTNGNIPDGALILHKCDNRLCCNPKHLRAGTQKENVADMVAKGRGKNQVKTHCPNGHAYDEVNTYRWGNVRQCRKCRVIQSRKHREKNNKLNQ